MSRTCYGASLPGRNSRCPFQNWDPAREINAYPPSTGAFALYTRSNFYELFDYSADVYYHLEDHVINPIYKVLRKRKELASVD